MPAAVWPRAGIVCGLLGVLALTVFSCGRKGHLLPADQARPGPVRELTVRGTDEGMTLSWQVPASGGELPGSIPLSGYRILRSSGGSGFSAVGYVPAPFDFWEIREMIFSDTDIDPATSYRYRVIAVNVLKAESEPVTSQPVRGAGGSSHDLKEGPARGAGEPSPSVGGRPVPLRREFSVRGARGERGPGGRVYLWWDPPPAPSGFVYEVVRVDDQGAEHSLGTVQVPFFVDEQGGEALSYRIRMRGNGGQQMVVGAAEVIPGAPGPPDIPEEPEGVP